MKQRRGQISDIIVGLLLSVSIAIISVTMLTIMQAFNSDYDMDSTQQTAFNRALTSVTYFDLLQLLLIGGLSVSLVGTAFFIKTHPVFFFANLVLLAVVLFVSPVFSNTLTEFMDSDAMTTASSSFPLTAAIRDSYPVILMVIGLIFLIALYAKFANRGGGNVYEG